MTDREGSDVREFARAPEMSDHSEVNAWINSRMTQIQVFWHDRFDADASLPDEDGRPDRLPAHADDDLRLIHLFPAVAPGTREACYAVLPHGPEMFRRFERHLAAPTSDLSPAQARAMTARVAEQVAAVVPDARVAWSEVSLMDESAPGAMDIMMTTDDVPFLLEGLPSTPDPGSDPSSRAAALFLAEPHYAAAGNTYPLHHWVTAAMLDPALDAIYQTLYLLSRSQWQVFCGQDGVIVVNRNA